MSSPTRSDIQVNANKQIAEFALAIGGEEFKDTSEVIKAYKTVIEAQNLFQTTFLRKIENVTPSSPTTHVAALFMAIKSIEDCLEIVKGKANQFREAVGGDKLQNSIEILKITNSYTKFSKGKITAEEFHEILNASTIPDASKEAAKKFIPENKKIVEKQASLSSSSKNEIDNASQEVRKSTTEVVEKLVLDEIQTAPEEDKKRYAREMMRTIFLKTNDGKALTDDEAAARGEQLIDAAKLFESYLQGELSLKEFLGQIIPSESLSQGVKDGAIVYLNMLYPSEQLEQLAEITKSIKAARSVKNS